MFLRTPLNLALRIVALWLAALLMTSAALPAKFDEKTIFASAVSGHGFNLLNWEFQALIDKATPTARLSRVDVNDSDNSAIVTEYVQRAQQMSNLEAQLAGIASSSTSTSSDSALQYHEIQDKLDQLRGEQRSNREHVERIVQAQISAQLRDAGFGVAGRVVPPVFFTFTEPPKSLIVSPRDRIETIYSRMLKDDITLEEMVAIEESIHNDTGGVAYVTPIGGLGAFPTMVVERAGIDWILSTVVHEWVHNYLTFYPLGWAYFSSHEMTLINETVAEIVGLEIGTAVLQRYYPEQARVDTRTDNRDGSPPSAFDFVTEMRKTRLTVDRLLSEGKVGAAERFMEQRRQIFVRHGYPLRVLNQAYFAFHGSYGTSAASSSPNGPKLFEIRAAMPTLVDFVHAVRWISSANELTVYNTASSDPATTYDREIEIDVRSCACASVPGTSGAQFMFQPIVNCCKLADGA